MSFPYFGPPKKYDTFTKEQCEEEIARIGSFERNKLFSFGWHQDMIYLRNRIYEFEYQEYLNTPQNSEGRVGPGCLDVLATELFEYFKKYKESQK